MAEIAVVGAGVGGMAVAARLAKLGHSVTVFEQGASAGGTLQRFEHDGFTWDAGPSSVGLPAVLRDLFRKSGRPIERYLDLRLSVPARRHVFRDGASVDLPTGSRADQLRAVDAGLGAGAGRCWTEFVDAQAGVWDVYRRTPGGPDGSTSPAARALDKSLPVRQSLQHVVSRALPDERLRELVSHRFVMRGSEVRNVPAYAAVHAYVERSFGVWTCPTGLAELTDALVVRLAERRVDVRLGTPVTRILQRGGRAAEVELSDGTAFRTDAVVAAMDPLVVFGTLLGGGRASRALRVFASATRVNPPAVSHLGLRNTEVQPTADEVVLHGDPLVVISTTGSAPAGHRAWTVRRRGDATEDVLTVMASRGIDVRDELATRVDSGPRQILSQPGGAPGPIGWDGWRAHTRRSALANPMPGLHVLAAALTPDASIPQVVWTAAHVAARIGKP